METQSRCTGAAVKASGPPDAASIYDSEITRANSDAIVPALETLAYGDVEENKELDPRFVEQHMDDTSRYLAQCYAIRREYGDVAKLYIDTSLKAEEFFRLERIHNLEVAAGIYSLDYEDSTDQVKSAQAATDGRSWLHRLPLLGNWSALSDSPKGT